MLQIERTFLTLQGYLLRRLTTAPGVPPPAEVETAGALAGNPPRLPAPRDHEMSDPVLQLAFYAGMAVGAVSIIAAIWTAGRDR